MAKLTMGKSPDKLNVNNSGSKAVGITLGLSEITKADPFASLFDIRPEVLEAIRDDMKTNGFDPSKPVNVWKTAAGKRILIDGYTRVRAAEELSLLEVTAYEKTFKDEAEAVAYAIHTQKDRRNLSDAELFRLLERIDKPQRGFKAAIEQSIELPATVATDPFPPNGGNGIKPRSTAELTAATIGISPRKVERFRTVQADPEEAAAVRAGKKTIHQAAADIKAKRVSPHARGNLEATFALSLTADELDTLSIVLEERWRGTRIAKEKASLVAKVKAAKARSKDKERTNIR
jgi:ParB family transcriptional regulator, chromosome partitioning protein